MPERLVEWVSAQANRSVSGRLTRDGIWEITATNGTGNPFNITKRDENPWCAALKLCWALIGQPNETAIEIAWEQPLE